MSPEYFKFQLRPYEAELYVEGLYMRQRSGWEQARLIVSPWQSKDSEPLVFPWESEVVEPPKKEEIEDTLQWAAKVAEQLNLKHNG